MARSCRLSSPRARRSSRTRRCSRSTHGRTRRRLTRRRPTWPKTRRSCKAPSATWHATASWSAPASRPARASRISRRRWGNCRAQVQADNAAIETAQLNLGFTTIRAPITGRTGALLIDPGNFVQASAGTSLVSITQMKPIYVSFTLPATNLDAIRQNQATHLLEVDAYGADGNDIARQGHAELHRQPCRYQHRHDRVEGHVLRTPTNGYGPGNSSMPA